MTEKAFTSYLWTEGEVLLERMHNHPFNRELASGRLSQATFSYYLQQDEHYIRDYTSGLMALAERVEDGPLRRDLELFATDGLALEQQMHQVFFVRYQIQATQQRSLACSTYGEFLLTQARQAPKAVALAAFLPCFWFYWQVGEQILAEAAENNPYQPWIDTYSGDDFQRQVETLLAHVDNLACDQGIAERQLMRDAFITSSLLELAFWDSAYLIGKPF
ncbi:MAG: TenA family protein [Desulfuromonadales bacterium]|nr:TenA family protein [Desulfuromonadales bacterium]MBN2793367.1 TenA family protein [Desulfuromonadales bacterium]